MFIEQPHHRGRTFWRLNVGYAWFLAAWAKRLSWNEVACAFRTTWDQVFSSVEMAVSWGREHQNLEGIEAIGVDEIAWQRGRRCLTRVYPIDAGCRRLLWIGQERKARMLLRFFRWLGQERTQELRTVCSELWKPYLKVIAKKAGHALQLLDRFHIMAQRGKAIDPVRAEEARKLKREGYEPILSSTRWLFLKCLAHLTAKQASKWADLLRYHLKTVRSILLKQEFQRFWCYPSWYWAGKFLDG